jgi:hypothetical protein
LDDLVFQCGDSERELLPVRLRYVPSARWQCPIGSSMDTSVQILNATIKVCLVVPPGQPVHARCGFSLEREKRQPKQFDAEMVEERSEPFLLPLPCCLPYALQRL